MEEISQESILQDRSSRVMYKEKVKKDDESIYV